MLKKLSNRIIFSNLILIIILIFIIFSFISTHLRQMHIELIKKDIQQKITYIEKIIVNKKFCNNKLSYDIIHNLSTIMDLKISVIDLQGSILINSDKNDSKENVKYQADIKTALKNGTGDYISYSSKKKTYNLFFAKKSKDIIIRTTKSLEELDSSQEKIRKVIFFSGVLILFSSLIIIMVISKRITRPINETLAFAKEFSNGNYSKRILNYSDDEIGMLQKSLNKLADTILEKINSLIFEQNKLQITIESILDGIVVVDINKKILIVNNAFKKILDVSTIMTGKSYYEVIRSSALNSKIQQALMEGQSKSFELELITENHCDVFITPIKEEKTIQGILIVVRDITDKKKIEQMKTDLVSNMSHELKTPIAILKGYLETVFQHQDNPEMVKNLLEKALTNVDRQSSLISDILKLNRLETTDDFVHEVINLKEVIEGCIDILKPKSNQKEITIHTKYNNNALIVKGNRFLAEEVFFNLIDNAINYNHKGGSIEINHEKDNFYDQTMISIKDSGIGIPEESIDRLFERFYRVDKSRSRATGGTGLGLSIVKHAIDLLDWNIAVKSTDKKGTTFTITI